MCKEIFPFHKFGGRVCLTGITTLYIVHSFGIFTKVTAISVSEAFLFEVRRLLLLVSCRLARWLCSEQRRTLPAALTSLLHRARVCSSGRRCDTPLITIIKRQSPLIRAQQGTRQTQAPGSGRSRDDPAWAHPRWQRTWAQLRSHLGSRYQLSIAQL